MFRINSLRLFGFENEQFLYEFDSGLNYFKGKNSSGKTEFYSFIDFMFGSSEDIREKPWYIDSLKKATMIFEMDEIEYRITRTDIPEVNYLHYADEDEGEEYSISLREYREKLNSIFTSDNDVLKEIRNFTDEKLTYRTFTMFNFLGEKRQGSIHDFFDKCSKLRYSIKLTPILNFIFNKNIARIFELQQELNDLLVEVKNLETASAKYDFIVSQINNNLQKLGLNTWYDGNNSDQIKRQINELKNMQLIKKNKKEKSISDLEVMYNNITEQIKIYENGIQDSKRFEKDNKNRKYLLEKLNEIVVENNTYEYLVTPLRSLITELDTTISFSKYVINDHTIKELKNQRELLKTEMKRNDSRFRLYTLEEKEKAIVLIENYLTSDIRSVEPELNEKRKRIREIREALKVLQSSDDTQKINELSQYITNLYFSAKDISSVVEDDMKQDGFKIQYIKRGNILQPMVTSTQMDENDFEKTKSVQYYIGSMARHTLIQLCGYLGFLNMLIKEAKYPLIPILVIDHISKPFDQSNCQAIGKVIATAYESIGKDNLQIFIFDDEDYETLGIKPDYSGNLVTGNKTGFNPFYFASNTETEEKNEEAKKDDKN
ncbi:hypothetical protein SFC23_17070 [Shouchella clausii]|uniref:hypothetical protein n=1 Tax=Shouchella clausii TaxID=79880 RepID=UPI0039832794